MCTMTEDFNVKRPERSSHLPNHSIGKVFFDVLKQRDPGKTILVDGTTGKKLTNGELLDLSLKLAVNLKNLGVGKDDVVTIISQNNWQFVVTIIAGFYLGVKLNLLNHDYTSGEIKHFVAMCKPKAIFCTSKTIGNVLSLRQAHGNPDVVIFDDHHNVIENVHKFSNLIANVNSNNFQPVELMTKQQVCLILTSSGTTGYPKGVMLSQSNLRTTMEYVKDPNFLNFRDGESTLAFLPIFHMFGIVVCVGALLSDTVVVTLDKFATNVFLNLIQEYKITQLFTVPPILLFLAKSPLLEKYDLTSVKEVYCGAAPVSNKIERMVKERLGIKSVQQIYGMTETSGAITTSPRGHVKEGSVGKAITNFCIKISDIESGKSLGPNQVGELCVKGDGVMLGYCSNPEATKEAFEEDGFLKTGDLGYYDSDGYFYIVDRLKEIIKYKGFQVSPAELESHLNNHPGIKEAGVVGVPDERAGELPLAFVVKQPHKDVSEEDIIRYIAENVSIQKQLHGGVRFLDEIPKNASGKIIRKKLRELLV